MTEAFAKELESFQGVWQGGYYEGDPLNPMAKSSYQQLGFMSVLHATTLRCIRPYINDETIALEIGPGRGAWTRAMLGAKEVWTMDALSAEHNKFFEYVGDASNVNYMQVEDFTCSKLPDDHFTYMFSFGCLCHVSFDGVTAYAQNLFPKLKSGADCFWMVADYEKWNETIEAIENYSIWTALGQKQRRFSPLNFVLRKLVKSELKRTGNQIIRRLDEDNTPRPRRWYHAGVERTCEMLKETGYQIIDPDVGTVLRDPIICFRKP